MGAAEFDCLFEDILGFSCRAADLREQEVNAKGSVLISEVGLQLSDLLSEHLRSVANSANDTQSTGVGNSGSELRTGSNVHARKQDRMRDLEEVGDRCAKLFCRIHQYTAYRVSGM
jgi:hypothetical protein